MDSQIVESTDKITILARFFLPSLVLSLLLLGVYIYFKWKTSVDKREMEELKIDRLKLRMEALAAEKKARRKKTEPDLSPVKPVNPPETGDTFEEEKIDVF